MNYVKISVNGFLRTAMIVSVTTLLSSCVQSDTSTMTPAERVAEYQAKQKEMLEAQKAKIEDQRQKILAKQLAKTTTSGLTTRIQPNAPAKAEKSKPRSNVYNASISGNIRASGNIKANAPWKCVPGQLKKVLNDVSRKYGRIVINSTHRSHRKNRRVGGARSSWHLKCKAVDFRVRGNTRGLHRYLRNHPYVGGLKRYRSGYYHIDVGPRRSW